jgi:TatD DNase family protein
VNLDDSIYGQLKNLALSSKKVLVISEIGLDFMEGAPDKPLQYQAFREQIRLARDVDMPIIFHSRESHDEVFRLLREEQAYTVGGAMHYFQGDERTANQAIDLGFYISLAKPLLRLPHLQKIAARLPLENIVLETDSAPQPFKAKRSNWTEPRDLKTIAETLAILQNKSMEEIQQTVWDNVKKMLGNRWFGIDACADSNRQDENR